MSTNATTASRRGGGRPPDRIRAALVTQRRRLEGALVVTRCDDATRLGPVELPPGHGFVELDMDDHTDVGTWLEVVADAFDRSWTFDDHRRAVLLNPVIAVAQTLGVADPSGEVVGVASLGFARRNRRVGMGHYLAVRRRAGGGGVGDALVAERYRRLARLGAECFESQTHVVRTLSLRLHFRHGFLPKYRFDPWNTPDVLRPPERAVTSARLWVEHQRWRRSIAASVPGR